MRPGWDRYATSSCPQISRVTGRAARREEKGRSLDSFLKLAIRPPLGPGYS